MILACSASRFSTLLGKVSKWGVQKWGFTPLFALVLKYDLALDTLDWSTLLIWTTYLSACCCIAAWAMTFALLRKVITTRPENSAAYLVQELLTVCRKLWYDPAVLWNQIHCSQDCPYLHGHGLHSTIYIILVCKVSICTFGNYLCNNSCYHLWTIHHYTVWISCRKLTTETP